MLEKALSVLAAVGIPALGLILRASRGNRLRQRMKEYLGLAEEIADHDSKAAAEFRRLASEAAHLLVLKEERWIRRKIDPSAVFAILFLTLPAAGVAVWAWTWDSGWRWSTVVVATIWTLLWGGIGITQIWQERGDEAEATAAA
jgi:hypothetical protein